MLAGSEGTKFELSEYRAVESLNESFGWRYERIRYDRACFLTQKAEAVDSAANAAAKNLGDYFKSQTRHLLLVSFTACLRLYLCKHWSCAFLFLPSSENAAVPWYKKLS